MSSWPSNTPDGRANEHGQHHVPVGTDQSSDRNRCGDTDQRSGEMVTGDEYGCGLSIGGHPPLLSTRQRGISAVFIVSPPLLAGP
jgi:hypothetical protein